MLLRSIPHLHYPITVTRLLFKHGDTVPKNAPIFNYSYKSTVQEYDTYGEATNVEKTFPTRYESQVEGTVKSWKVSKGTVIERPGVDLLEITEPCQHNVQFGGMCADCGKDMTEVDYGTTTPDHLRANVSVAHSAPGLKVSADEAYRTETASKRRLLESRKLSLVVDLDQTIIHATVDPTVGEWMADVENPNHDAVKDVQKFQLEEEGPPHNCWYYVKMRPGLKAFLEKISKLYELHIYTMGTRAYARHVARIVDPQKKIFADRILSRDENGSLTAKSLHRLFPVDARMVVIIDDRGDVWDWSKSLIKVVPYDFFKGIGDINSSFLPKRQDIVAEAQPPPPPAAAETSEDPGTAKEDTPLVTANENVADTEGKVEPSTIDKLVTMSGPGDAAALQEKVIEQDEQLASQIADRPLLQQQLELEQDEEQAQDDANGDVNDSDNTQKEALESPKPRHNLLKDDDVELDNLERALKDVHQHFYATYTASMTSTVGGGRVSQLKGERSPKKRPDLENMSLVPDVQTIMPEMKGHVLSDCHLVFSGVIPLSSRPENHDIWRWAVSFGATVDTEVSNRTTHVIGTRERYTGKMRTAARSPAIKIVSLDWLTQACREWRKPKETLFIIPVEPSKKRKREGYEPEGGSSQSEDDWLTPVPPWVADINEDDIEQGDGDASPIDDVAEDEWDEMRAEFDDDDFDESEDSGTASPTGDDNKKRKRDDNVETASQAGNESDNSTASRGRRKKRREFGRTSSLSHVTTLNSLPVSSGEATDIATTADTTAEKGANGVSGPEEESDDDDDWDFTNEVQRALAEAGAKGY